MSQNLLSLKKKLVDTMNLLVYRGLTNPKGGNGSFRYNGVIWITPSGLAKHMLAPTDLVAYDPVSNKVLEGGKPSIELRAHLAIYEKIDSANSVLHAHLPLSTALTDILGSKHWWEETMIEVEYSIGEVAIAKPAFPGSIELARNIGEVVDEDTRVVVVPRHGVFAWGYTIEDALDALIAFEDIAKYYIVKELFRKELL